MNKINCTYVIGGKTMTHEREVVERNDLLEECLRSQSNEEVVNLYEKDCGQVQLHCVTDCFPFGTSFINPDR
ncbi:MAG: hypothetical protein ACLUAF_16330 [Paraclostridium sordellii]